jgi:cysteinyl-tRNA synthetase
LFADLLRRWLEYLGLEVSQVMNITDVGHLTDDADMDGEDKIEAQARREKIDPQKIADGYAELFLADVRELGVLAPMAYPRATDHIPEMLEIINGLIEKGHAYEKAGNVYFDVTTFPRYGRLSGNKVEDLEAGKRVEVREDKRHPADFALWKADPKHLMKWESRYGPDGFPGWHIECSAMARKLLGDELDIHTGGEDNVFPHHECEIAQSECFTGVTFARFWMHAKFLTVDGGKMSKSLGNIYTLDDIKERGYQPRALRYALMRGHYRQPLNFTWEILEESRAALEKLDDLAHRLRLSCAGTGAAADADGGGAAVDSAQKSFEDGLNDDLNMPQALASLFELRSTALEGSLGTAAAQRAMAFLKRANSVVGVLKLEEDTLDARVHELIAARVHARETQDWAASDRIRDELNELDVVVQDTPDGTIWRKKG